MAQEVVNPAVPLNSGVMVTPNGPQVPETLQQPNTKYVPKANPLERLKAKAIDIPAPALEPQIIPQIQVPPQIQQFQAPQIPVDPQSQPDPNFKGNPWARMRIVERERDIERRKNQELEQKLDKMAEALEVITGKLVPEEEEEEAPPSNPIEAIQRGQEEILKRLNAENELREKQATLTVEQQEEQKVNLAIQGFVQQAEQAAPGVYKQAVAHLSNAWLSEYMEDNPDATEDAAFAYVAEKAHNFKMAAYAKGENPGEAFLRRSVLFGFTPQVAQHAAPQPQAAAQHPTQTVQQAAQELARKNNLGSLSNMSGSGTQDPARGLHLLPEKDRVRAMMQMQREQPNRWKTIPLSRTLAHKITQ